MFRLYNLLLALLFTSTVFAAPCPSSNGCTNASNPNTAHLYFPIDVNLPADINLQNSYNQSVALSHNYIQLVTGGFQFLNPSAGSQFNIFTQSGQDYIINTGNTRIAKTPADIAPNSAFFQVASTEQGSIPAPIMTQAQEDAIASSVAGMQVFNSSDNTVDVFDNVGTVHKTLSTDRIIQGANMTVTDNNDGTVTLASSGSGSSGTQVQGSFICGSALSATAVTTSDSAINVGGAAFNSVNAVGTNVNTASVSGVLTPVIQNNSIAGRWGIARFDLSMNFQSTVNTTYVFTIYTNTGATIYNKQLTISNTAGTIKDFSFASPLIYLNANDYLYLTVRQSTGSSSYFAQNFSGSWVDTTIAGIPNTDALAQGTSNKYLSTDGGATIGIPLGATLSYTGSTLQTSAMSGDVTTSANSFVNAIANSAVTNAKIANSTIDLTTKVTGVLPFANGGLGPLSSVATGDLVSASAANTPAAIADVATGQVLTSGGVGVLPAYSATPTLSQINLGASQTQAQTTAISLRGANSTIANSALWYSAADQYPVIQVSGYAHGNNFIDFDAYFDGTNSRASVNGSAIQLMKTSTAFQINYGVSTQGVTLSWANALSISGIGGGVTNTVSTTTPTLTLSATTNSLRMENGSQMLAKNNSGTYEGFMFPRFTDNRTYFDVGSAGLTMRLNGGTTQLSTDTSNNVSVPNGNLNIDGVGKTLGIKSGTNSCTGSFTLVAGAATITSTCIQANDIIVLMKTLNGGVASTGQLTVVPAAGSATVTGGASDTSTEKWVAFHVN